MKMLYDMDQHRFACKQNFRVEWSYGSDEPHSISHVVGFSGVLSEIETWEHSLTVDKMFRIFIDNKASKHNVIFIGDKGELLTTIKIVTED